MITEKIFFFLFIFLPFLVIFVPTRAGRGTMLGAPTAVGAYVRIFFLSFLGRNILFAGQNVQLQTSLIEGYPIDFTLLLDKPRFFFLLLVELCFLLAYWLCNNKPQESRLSDTLICILHGLTTIFILSQNVVVSGAMQILASIVIFYLVHFSIKPELAKIGTQIAKSALITYLFLGILFVIWGVAEFGNKDLNISKIDLDSKSAFLWILILIMSTPMFPWGRWLEKTMEYLPEYVSIAVVSFISAVSLKYVSIFSDAYPQLSDDKKLFIYCIGMLGCIFSISRVFSVKNTKQMIGRFPAFFFSLILISVGLSQSQLVSSAYYICLVVPILVANSLFASTLGYRGKMEKLFLGLLIIIVLGIPGTPIYMLLSFIGTRSIEMGTGYSLLFACLWLLYFSMNVHVYKRIFLDEPLPAEGLEAGNKLIAVLSGFCFVMAIALTVIAQFIGRFL